MCARAQCCQQHSSDRLSSIGGVHQRRSLLPLVNSCPVLYTPKGRVRERTSPSRASTSMLHSATQYVTTAWWLESAATCNNGAPNCCTHANKTGTSPQKRSGQQRTISRHHTANAHPHPVSGIDVHTALVDQASYRCECAFRCGTMQRHPPTLEETGER